MKLAIIFVVAAFTASAQIPTAKMINTSRTGSTDFQIGDRYQVIVSGAPNLPVSLRTMRQGRTDWSPVIAYTDASGRWSTEGQFEKQDFGGWTYAWTVGDTLASPVVAASIKAPCIPGGQDGAFTSGPNEVLNCLTVTGQQTFVSPSMGDSFRTPDGRVVPAGTPEQMMGDLIEQSGGHSGLAGNNAAILIAKVIGANALDDREMRNIIQIVRIAFQNLDRNLPAAKNPVETLVLLRQLESRTKQESVKQEIAATMVFVQSI